MTISSVSKYAPKSLYLCPRCSHVLVIQWKRPEIFILFVSIEELTQYKYILAPILEKTYSSVLISESSSQVVDGRRGTLLFSTST